VKRFAKIGGEMVSMAAASAGGIALAGALHAVISLPDQRKGERAAGAIRQDADAKELLALARTRMIPEIMVPRAVLCVPSVPLLGTGKEDYPAVQLLGENARTSSPVDVVPA
jgi:acyl-[acyl-carrier-protein]-phospholipid O-acyltransferase/long-chain-fatty-acid--[acyl-carrier-protein] ligase